MIFFKASHSFFAQQHTLHSTATHALLSKINFLYESKLYFSDFPGDSIFTSLITRKQQIRPHYRLTKSYWNCQICIYSLGLLKTKILLEKAFSTEIFWYSWEYFKSVKTQCFKSLWFHSVHLPFYVDLNKILTFRNSCRDSNAYPLYFTFHGDSTFLIFHICSFIFFMLFYIITLLLFTYSTWIIQW